MDVSFILFPDKFNCCNDVFLDRNPYIPNNLLRFSFSFLFSLLDVDVVNVVDNRFIKLYDKSMDLIFVVCVFVCVCCCARRVKELNIAIPPIGSISFLDRSNISSVIDFSKNGHNSSIP